MVKFIKKQKYKLLEEQYGVRKVSISIKNIGYLMISFILITTIGYATINEEMRISGEVKFRIEKDIRITNLKFVRATNGGKEEYNAKYSTSGIITGISLPNIDSEVIYEVTVSNVGNVDMKLKEVIKENFSNVDITYVMVDITPEDIIPKMSTKIFEVKFKYNSNIDKVPLNQILESRLELAFVRYEAISNKLEFIKVAAGRYHTLALTKDGYVYSWGHNDVKQLGDGTTTTRLNPIKIAELTNIVDISAGYGSSYAINSEGEVYSWGYGLHGQLGHGSTSNYGSPTKVSKLIGEKIVQIDAGYHSVIALTEDGRIYTWGYNGYKQLGDGTTSIADKSSPYRVESLSSIKYISTGYWHMMAATETEVYGWGSNLEGQLGKGEAVTTSVPIKLKFPANIRQISAGGRHSLVLTDDDKLYGFGYNLSGQVGIGSTTTYIREPQLISVMENINSIDAGYDDSVAITNNGDVYAWGYNSYAKLGLGNTTTQRSPVLNNNINNIGYITAQYETIFYITLDTKNIYGSGYNLFGALGNGTTSNTDSSTWKSIPSKVIFDY